MILDLFHQFELYILALVASYPRMLAFFSTALLFSQTTMTRTSRNGLVLVLCLVLAPLNHAALVELDPEPGSYFLTLLKEYVLGFGLGYAVGWMFWGIQAAGALIDNQRGASIAESLDPLQGHQSSPLGNLFSIGIATYLFLTGGILLLVGILYESYRIWPVFAFLPVFASDFPRLMIGILDHGMRLAFVFAAPVVLIMFIAEAALAMVSRFAPQVQVFILAMPIKSGLAMVLLVMYIAILFPESARRHVEAEGFAARLFEFVNPLPALSPGGRAQP